VERDAYLLELSRYVVLNPVRAGMVDDVVEWGWSSYREMIGQVESDSWWLETRWILGQFGAVRSSAIQRYMNFVRAGVGLPPLWSHLKGQQYLGSDAFVSDAV